MSNKAHANSITRMLPCTVLWVRRNFVVIMQQKPNHAFIGYNEIRNISTSIIINGKVNDAYVLSTHGDCVFQEGKQMLTKSRFYCIANSAAVWLSKQKHRNHCGSLCEKRRMRVIFLRCPGIRIWFQCKSIVVRAPDSLRVPYRY